MSRPRALFVALFAVLALALGACAGQAPAAQSPADGAATAGGRVVTIGYTASLSGKLNVESVRQQNGLKLWMDQVNAAGGLKLADGTTVTFAPKSYDDESNKDRVQELYTRLATEDNADFLVSPYSSGLTDAAAVIAEQYGKVMITTGAASDDTYTKGYTLVYQLYTPASRYLTGAIDMLNAQDPALKKLAIVYENDKFSTSVVDAVKAYAEGKGYEVVLFEKQVPVKFISLLVAPPEPSFAELGEAAVGIVGPSQWEPQAAFTAAGAAAQGLAWLGPESAAFVEAYEQAFGEAPSYHAAGGYAAGLVLQRAIEQAGTTETASIKATLDGLDMLTFFGRIKFDVTPAAHGLQVGHEMVYVQWQGAPSALAKEITWPASAETAKAIFPIR